MGLKHRLNMSDTESRKAEAQFSLKERKSLQYLPRTSLYSGVVGGTEPACHLRHPRKPETNNRFSTFTKTFSGHTHAVLKKGTL